MGFRALIDNKLYTADNPAVKEMQIAGAEILCPECKSARLSYHRETVRHDDNGMSFKVSAHFVTLQKAVHSEWCTYPAKRNDKDEKEPAIVIFDRHFGEKSASENKGNPQATNYHPSGEKRDFPEPRISSLKKFVSFLQETLSDPELTKKLFKYRGTERKWNEIYFDSSNMSVLFNEALKTDFYRIENESVFAKIKTDSSAKIHLDEVARKTNNPNGKYSVYGLPFTYVAEDRTYHSIRTRINFSDRKLMEKFLESGSHIVRAVPEVHVNSKANTYLDFDIYAKEQFEALPTAVQTSMFKTSEKPKQEHGRRCAPPSFPR